MVVACLATDTIGWVADQMRAEDALVVATRVAYGGVWWSFLAGLRSSAREITTVEPVGVAGLELSSTIGDFARADAGSSGRLVAGRL